MARPFTDQRTLITVLAVVVIALIVVLLVNEFALNRPAISGADPDGPGRCAVARRALDAFDAGKPPPAEWIQDRAEAKRAVRECERSR